MLSRGDLRRVAGLLGVKVTDLFEGDVEITNDSPDAFYRERCVDEILGYLSKMSNDEMRLAADFMRFLIER